MAVNMQVGAPYGPPVDPYQAPSGLPMAGTPPGPPVTGPTAMPEPPPPPPPAPPVNQPSITPAEVSAIESAVSDAANIGAQGAPRPTMSSEARQRATNISRILEQQLLAQTRPGFGDIISAALQTVQKPGQVDFATALRQAQSQDLTRAYNIANALSGLERRTAGQELTPRDMLRLVEAQASRGDRRFRDMLTSIDRAAQNFADPIAARETLLEAINKFDAPNKNSAQVMQEAVSYARQAGLPIKQPAAPKSAAGATEDIVKNPNTGLYTNVSGGRLMPWMVNYNVLVRAGRTDEAKAAEDRALTGTKPGAGEKEVTNFENQLAGADVAFSLMDQIRGQVAQRGASIMGITGSLSQALSGGLAQFAALTGINLDRPTEQLAAEFNRRFFADPQISDRTKSAFSWLERDNSPQAQAFKSNMLILGPTIAKSLDPGGRLSNQDVQQALQIIGQAGANLLTDPRAVNAALDQVEAYISNTLDARRRRITAINQRYPDPVPIRKPAAPAQPASQQAPAQGQFPQPTPQAIEFLRSGRGTREQFEQIFGPGSAQRALGG